MDQLVAEPTFVAKLAAHGVRVRFLSSQFFLSTPQPRQPGLSDNVLRSHLHSRADVLQTMEDDAVSPRPKPPLSGAMLPEQDSGHVRFCGFLNY